MSRAFDVVVVGAGVVGAAVACECAARGARVALLDRGEPGCQASGAAAGMLAPCSEAHQPGPFLDLARASLDAWPSFAERIHTDGGADPELHLDGLLRVALTEADADDVRARLAWQERHGITAGRWVDAAEAHELEPVLHRDIRGAAWYPSEGHVHSPRAVRALVEAARRHGASVRTGVDVIGRAPTGGVQLRNGDTITARHVILCAGAWLGSLTETFGGTRLPVRPVHGQLIALRGVPATPRRVLFAGPDGYAVGKRDGTVLVGATEADRAFETTPNPEMTAELQRRAHRLLTTAGSAQGVDSWAGLRPATPDNLPLLGPLPTSAGTPDTTVHVAGGHYRNGVLLAPATAAGMADMVLDGTTPPGWDPFDPRRFL